MTEIERLISRHLDGELTPLEETRLRKLLVESPDARALLREMTVLARAARRTPGLHVPGAGMESRLFERLRQEGLYQDTPVAIAQSVSTPDMLRKSPMLAVVRGALAVAMLIAVIGGGYLLNDHRVGPVARHARSDAPGSVSLASSGIVANRGVRGEIPAVIVQGHQDAGRDVRPGFARSSSAGAVVHTERSMPPVPSLPPADSSARLLAGNDASLPVHADTGAPVPLSMQLVDVPPVAQSQSLVMASAPELSLPSEHERFISASDERGGKWSASVRGGFASISANGESARELSLRVGMEIEGGHQMALLVGSSPTVTETRYRNTGIAMSVPAPSQVPSADRSPKLRQGLPEYQQSAASEAWLGVGYSYSVPLVAGFTLDPGIRAGIGNTTWRVGLELPVRYRLGGRVSMECALSASHVGARDASADESTQVNFRNNFIYTSTVGQAAFNSFGVQFGVRVDLTGD